MIKLPKLGLTGMWEYIVPAIVALTLIATIIFGIRGCAQDERKENANLVTTGQTIERERGHQEVINNVKEANDAVTNPTSNELNVVCEKYDRNC